MAKLSLAILLSLLTRSLAYPNGAGHCEAGAAILADDGSHGEQGSGGVTAGGFMILSNAFGWITSDATLPTGVDHYISINGDFRGFLFRLSAPNGDDVSSSMKLTDAAAEFGKSSDSSCGAGNVGFTHKSASDKTTIDVIIRHDTPVDLLLEITVVKKNSPTEVNAWYYEAFNLKLEDFPSPPTATSAPSVEGQTKSPTASPTISSSDKPSGVISGVWKMKGCSLLIQLGLIASVAALLM